VVTVNSMKSRGDLWRRVADRLSWPGWLGLGVIIATVIAAMSILLSSGGSSTYSNRGNCDAVGDGNTAYCPSVSPGTDR
jgi:hypothetical protein